MTREQLDALKVDLSDYANWAPTTRILVLQMFEEYASQRALIEQQAKEIERVTELAKSYHDLAENQKNDSDNQAKKIARLQADLAGLHTWTLDQRATVIDKKDAEIATLKAQLATVKGEVWESVMTHIREIPSDPHMTSTGALLLLHRWAREQKEAL